MNSVPDEELSDQEIFQKISQNNHLKNQQMCFIEKEVFLIFH